jgi:hypothetical protein
MELPDFLPAGPLSTNIIMLFSEHGMEWPGMQMLRSPKGMWLERRWTAQIEWGVADHVASFGIASNSQLAD